jgi:hypothetical protein
MNKDFPQILYPQVLYQEKAKPWKIGTYDFMVNRTASADYVSNYVSSYVSNDEWLNLKILIKVVMTR